MLHSERFASVYYALICHIHRVADATQETQEELKIKVAFQGHQHGQIPESGFRNTRPDLQFSC